MPTNTDRYIAKCRACGSHTSGLTHGQHARRNQDDTAREGDVFTGRMGDLSLACRTCGKAVPAKMVAGRHSERHICGTKCLASTGPSCTCSCGGKNHGASYSASESA